MARTFSFKRWTIDSNKEPILPASEADSLSSEISLRLPEICFGNNFLRIVNPHDSFGIRFSTRDALDRVDNSGDQPGAVRVRHADRWSKALPPLTVDTQRWDWTYSTDYAGTLVGDASAVEFVPAPSSHPGIPLARLASTSDDILYYDDVPLFEDELHDNGVSTLSVRLRVMPHSFFLLSRFFLRVDHVLFRIHDVRLYHSFSSNEVIRECKGREMPYSQVLSRLPRDRQDDLTPLTNADWVANIMGMLQSDSDSDATQQGQVCASPKEHSDGLWKGLGTRLEIATLP